MSDTTTPQTDAVPPEIPGFLLATEGLIRAVDLRAAQYKKQTGDSLASILTNGGKLNDWLFITTMFGMEIFLASLLTTELWLSGESAKILSNIRITTATFLAKIGLHLAISVHNLLSAAWEDYRLMFRGVHAAAAGLSGTIGMEAGFLSLALINAQNIVTAGGVVLGKDPAQTHVNFLRTTGSFLQTWSDKWENYHRNPAGILDELQQWVLDNSFRDESRAIDIRTKMLTDAVAATTKLTTDLLNVELSINQFITDLPSDVFSIVQEWYKPYHDEVANIRDTYLFPAIEFINEIDAQVTLLSRENDVTRAQYQAALASLPDILTGIYLNTSTAGMSNRGLFESVVLKATGLTHDSADQDTKDFNSRQFITPPTQVFEPIEILPTPDTGVTAGALPQPPPISDTIYAIIQGDVAHQPENTLFDTLGGTD